LFIEGDSEEEQKENICNLKLEGTEDEDKKRRQDKNC